MFHGTGIWTKTYQNCYLCHRHLFSPKPGTPSKSPLTETENVKRSAQNKQRVSSKCTNVYRQPGAPDDRAIVHERWAAPGMLCWADWDGSCCIGSSEVAATGGIPSWNLFHGTLQLSSFSEERLAFPMGFLRSTQLGAGETITFAELSRHTPKGRPKPKSEGIRTYPKNDRNMQVKDLFS